MGSRLGFLVFLTLLISGPLTLSGCAKMERAWQRAAEASRQREAVERRNYAESLRAQCRSYGFTDGSSAMAQCVMQVDVNRRNAKAAKEAADCAPTSYTCSGSGGNAYCTPNKPLGCF